MENEVCFLKTQRPLRKIHFCKANLTKFLLERDQKIVLYLKENKSPIKKTITTVKIPLFKCILPKSVYRI